MNIFLDACIIIYWAEASEPFYSYVIARLDKITQDFPHHNLAISRFSFLECLVKPLREKDKKTLAIYQKFFELPNLSIIEIDRTVIDLATSLRAHHKLRTPDAIQAASCLLSKGKHIFLTNDKCFSNIPHLNSILL